MNPAQALAAALEAHGASSQAAQSRLLGVTPPLWNAWLQGKKLMREDSIQRCLFAAFDTGIDLRLEWRADGCVARIVEPVEKSSSAAVG